MRCAKHVLAVASVVAVTVTSISATLLTIASPARAFFPSFLREVGGTGVGHPSITRSAIEIVLRESYGITKTTKSIDKAIQTICDGNALVDTDQFLSSKHFDGENFLGGQEYIAYERNIAISAADGGDVGLARLALGGAMHPLQDFYSHSNWIELGRSTPLDLLTRPGSTEADLIAALDRWKALQGPRDAKTCQACELGLACGKDCSKNLIATGLTSGYYGGEDRKPPASGGKCSHGGASDTAAPGFLPAPVLGGPLSSEGINKDGAQCVWSPHYFSHVQAAATAIVATADFLRAYKSELSDANFKRVMGIGPGLALALDTTSSMEPIIDQVRDGIDQIIEENETAGEASRYVLVPFKDPEVGPTTQTSDPDEFTSRLAQLEIGGGGDCPEPSLAAVERTVSAADTGSSVFLFTNGTASDGDRADAVSALANAKDVTIYPSLFGSCSPYDPAYFKLAEATGGQVFVLNPEEASKVTAVIESTGDPNQAHLSASQRDLTSAPIELILPVDSSLTELTVSVTAVVDVPENLPAASATQALVAAELLPPVDAADVPGTVTATDLSSGRILVADRPGPGNWRLRLTGTARVKVVATALTTRQLRSFHFVEINGRPDHEGWFPIEGMPIAGQTTRVAVELSELSDSASVTLLSSEGDVLTTANLAASDPEHAPGWLTGDIAVPAEPFYVQVSAPGQPEAFVRGVSRLFQPQDLAIRVSKLREGPPGSTVLHPIELHNYGASGSYDVLVVDAAGYVTKTADTISIGAGEDYTYEVEADLPEDAPPFTEDAATVVFQSTTSPALRTFTVLRTRVVLSVESDDDLVPQQSDNCPAIANTEQLDTDSDGMGDVCDTDQDDDGTPNDEDNCPLLGNASQDDQDKDDLGDACDPDPNCACVVVGGNTGSMWPWVVTLTAASLSLASRRRRRQASRSGERRS